MTMAVETGGGVIFCQPKKFKSIKTTTYKSVYRNMAKYVHSSMDIIIIIIIIYFYIALPTASQSALHKKGKFIKKNTIKT